MSDLRWILILLSVLLWSCSSDSEPEPVSGAVAVLSKIGMAADGTFVERSGKTFFPWGLNYTNAEDVGLIEDNWDDESVWETIESDFREMRALSANVVRIHLQYHQFMLDAKTPNPKALDRLSDLVAVAEENGLYLDITGLAAYRKSDTPLYYSLMSDEERWATQKIFWQSIADQVKDSPAVFAYNLMNEPVVAVQCEVLDDCDWLPGEGFGGYHFVQNISRDPEKQFTLTMQQWIADMTSAIRRVDSESLITVGFLGLGPLDRFAADLDYVSVHIYPDSDDIEKSISYVQAKGDNVTVVIEETSNLHCSIDELGAFVDGISGHYAGLMGHYHGTPINDLDSGSIRAALQKQFLTFFMNRAPD